MPRRVLASFHRITIFDHQKKFKINKNCIIRIVKKILSDEKISRAELSVVFVNRRQIQAFNRRFLKRSYATDVLAFNLSDSKSALVGDIIISTDAAALYARTKNLPVGQEIILYVVHGILHLLGYDDHNKKDITRMRRKEEKTMGKISTLIPRALIK